MEPTISHQTQLFNPVCVVVLKLGYIIQEIFLRLTSIVNYWYSNTKFKSYHIILLAAHLQVLKLLQHFFLMLFRVGQFLWRLYTYVQFYNNKHCVNCQNQYLNSY